MTRSSIAPVSLYGYNLVTTNLFLDLSRGCQLSVRVACFDYLKRRSTRMRLLRYLQHWLTGTGRPLRVADFVTETHPVRQ